MTGNTRPTLTPPSWLRIPGRSARLRFTILAGALFLLAGVTLTVVIDLLFVHDQSGSEQSIERSGPRRTNPGPITIGPQHTTITPGAPNGAASGSAGGRVAAAAQAASDKHALLLNSWVALAIVAALTLLFGWFFAGRMLRPIRTITATARRISASNLHERLALDGADEEFKQLGDTLDDLFARLEAAFEAQRHFVANASHELRTPLTAERTLLQVALDDPHTTNETWRATATEVLASSDEQARLIEALLTLASSEGGLDHPKRIDLAAIADEVVRRPYPGVERLGLLVETQLHAAPLEGDPKLIERLMANLVDNAVGHNVPDGHIEVSTAVADSGQAVLTVANTGPVIPPDEVSRLFQPFQRLVAPRTTHNDGHGLGLSIVQAIVGAHGASIEAHAPPQGGLRLQITFQPPTKGNESLPDS